MSDETIYENKRIKVTNEFLQIDNERCQITDIYDAIHLIQRDWKGVFGFSAAIIVIGSIVMSFKSVEAFLIGFLLLAICVFFVWMCYTGRHSLAVVQKTGDNMSKSMSDYSKKSDDIDNTIAAIRVAQNFQSVKEAAEKCGFDADQNEKDFLENSVE